MGKLFGTDGIRGMANEYPITSEMAVKIGRAVASRFTDATRRCKIIVGKDTRISGDMIEHALVSGICSMGADAYTAGTLPTPGIAYLTSRNDASAGIVISASHNPFHDNGIKIFDENGYKLSDGQEAEIEQAVLDGKIQTRSRSIRETGRVHRLEGSSELYATFLKQHLSKKRPLNGMKIVLDCANGATYQVAPDLFSDLGAEVHALGTNPDGKNINVNCGSEYPDGLAKKIIEIGADAGLAFDGDGDRLIVIDEKGQRISGDGILAICAKFLKGKGALRNDILVSTVMSNIGLGIALKAMGIKHVVTQVGDRYVLEKMIDSGAIIGGEDSGHVIFLDYHTTGDGLFTALRLLETMQSESQPLSELRKIIRIFPQRLINVKVQRKPEIESVSEIMDAIGEVEEKLKEQGRVLVRYSGTQPLCRIMVEAPTPEETRRYCRQIADVVQEKLG